MSRGATAPPRAALAMACAGALALAAGGFVALAFPLVLIALLAAVAGGMWVALATRRWQSALAVAALLYWFGRPAVEARSAPPVGTGTLVTLVAFAVLVIGGAWVGRHNPNA